MYNIYTGMKEINLCHKSSLGNADINSPSKTISQNGLSYSLLNFASFFDNVCPSAGTTAVALTGAGIFLRMLLGTYPILVGSSRLWTNDLNQ